VIAAIVQLLKLPKNRLCRNVFSQFAVFSNKEIAAFLKLVKEKRIFRF